MTQNLRLAVRRFLATPGFTAVAVLTLAIGIGANAALASIIAAVLLRPLPLAKPDALVAIRAQHAQTGDVKPISADDVRDWAQASRTVAAFGAWRDWSFSRSTPKGRERYFGYITTPGMFTVLGVQPILGRVFTDEDDRPGAAPVIVLTESAWRGRFSANPQIVGSTLTLTRAPKGDVPFTVIGVLPDIDLPSLQGLTFWAPSSVDEDATRGRWLRNRRVWARLHDGQSLTSARSELTGLAAQLARAYPDSHGGWTVDVRPLAEAEIGSTRATLWFFAAAVAFVLLIACANVAGLMLARAAGREREFAVRAALGGGRAHIMKVVLAEAIVLAAVAGVLSLLLRLWLLDIVSSLGPVIPRMSPVSTATAVALTAGFSFLAALLFGMLPAWQASRAETAALSRGGRSLTPSGARARTWLVGVQVALALMLLSAAAVSLRTLSTLVEARPGFEPDRVLVMQLFPSPSRYQGREALAQLVTSVLDTARHLPGVEEASTTSAGPMFGGNEAIELTTSARAAGPDGKMPTARFFDISPEYFSVLGVPLVTGRDFTARDASGAQPVAIVNEAFARRFLPGADAVGQRVTTVRNGRQLEVIGVVRDFSKNTSRDPIEPEIYWPFQQSPRGAFYLVVRSAAGSVDVVTSGLRARLAQMDPDLVPARMTTLAALTAQETRGARFAALILGLFAGSALLLAALGTFGLVSYSAAQRTREIGIRISFGATPGDIRRLVIGTGLRPILIGVAAGAAGSIAAGRILSSLLADAARPDAGSFAAAAALLLVTAVVATLIPARRATTIDPIVALGSE